MCGTPLWAVPAVWAMAAARAGRAEGTHRHHLCFLFAYFLFYFIPLLRHPLGCLKQGGGGAWFQGTLCWGCGSCFPGCQRLAISSQTLPADTSWPGQQRLALPAPLTPAPPRQAARPAPAHAPQRHRLPGEMAEEE